MAQVSETPAQLCGRKYQSQIC